MTKIELRQVYEEIFQNLSFLFAQRVFTKFTVKNGINIQIIVAFFGV